VLDHTPLYHKYVVQSKGPADFFSFLEPFFDGFCCCFCCRRRHRASGPRGGAIAVELTDDLSESRGELWQTIKDEARDIEDEILKNLIKVFLPRLAFCADVDDDWVHN